VKKSTMWLIVAAFVGLAGLAIDKSIVVLLSLAPLWMSRYHLHKEMGRKK
jgi:hypothetical protein